MSFVPISTVITSQEVQQRAGGGNIGWLLVSVVLALNLLIPKA